MQAMVHEILKLSNNLVELKKAEIPAWSCQHGAWRRWVSHILSVPLWGPSETTRKPSVWRLQSSIPDFENQTDRAIVGTSLGPASFMVCSRRGNAANCNGLGRSGRPDYP